jgi:WD40 repeat protein
LTEIARGHQHAIVSMAFRPDNQHLATASRDGTARIWEVATGKVLLVIDHPYDVLSVAYSPNGDMLATGTGAGGIEITVSIEAIIRLWDANTGKLLTMLEGQNEAVEQLQFSADGTHLASWDLQPSHGDPTILL